MSSDHPHSQLSILAPRRVVRRLLETVLPDADPQEDAWTWTETPPLPDDATWQEALEFACLGRGLRLRATILSAREAVGVTSSRTPLVLKASRGTGEWLLLLDRSGSRARVAVPGEPDCWLGPSELAERIGAADPDTGVPWVVVEPELPSQPPPKNKGMLPPLRRLSGLVKPDRADLLTIVIYAILVGGLSLATPIAVQQLVNSVAFGGLVQPVVILALLLFGALAFSSLLSALQAVVAESIQRRVFVRVVMDLAERLPRVEASAFDKSHGPELVNRLFDVVTVQKVGALLLLEGTSVVLQTVVGLLVLSFYHPWMLAFSVLLVGAVGVVVFGFGRGAVGTAVGESDAKYAVAEWMEELARHRAAFRSLDGRDYALARADTLASAYVVARERHFRIVLRQLSSALGLQVLAGSALLALGGGLVVAGQLTLGQLVASELILTAIVAAVAKLAKQLESFYDLLAAVEKLGVLFDLPLEREDGGIPEIREGPAAVELTNLSFSYENENVIEGLSLRVEPGERVAVLGPTGAGRSTLLNLLAGLRTPTAGYITIDDHDLRDLRLDSIREQIVYIREPELFSGSVLDNVRVSTTGPSVEEVCQALDQVGLLEEVRRLPGGIRTELTTDGAPLTTDQRARLMMARAIAAKPRLMLLDKALAQLNEANRKQVLDAVFDPDAPWTILVVSERPDVVDRTTRIVELSSATSRASEG